MCPNTALLWSSLKAIETNVLAIPPVELANHHRNIAFGYMQVFYRFASEICGCSKPDDRVALRKAVFHQTVGLKLNQFKPTDPAHIPTLARMECPVTLVGFDESAPCKIILASKIFRSHFAVNEATTCRGCSKRGKCSFVRKVVPTHPGKTSLGSLAKILFGVSQLCRQHLLDPAKFPLVMTANDFEAALGLTNDLTELLRPTATDRQLANLSVADEKAIRRIIKIQLEKKKATQKSDLKPDTLKESEWIEEGERPILEFPKMVSKDSKMKPKIVLDDFRTKPVIERKVGKISRKPVPKNTSINMSDILKPLPSTPSSGGYTWTPTMDSGVEYIKPAFLRGKRVVDNVKLASKLFEKKDISFLKKVPFQSVVHQQQNTPNTNLAQVLEDPTRTSKLLFPEPKLPKWKTEPKVHRNFFTEKLKINDTVVERVNTEFSSLLRPPDRQKKENARPAKTKQPPRTTSPVDLAKIWSKK